LVIVLLKAIVAIASNLMVQPPNGQQPGPPGQNNGPNGAGKGQGPNGQTAGVRSDELLSPSDEQIDATRGREISAKAVTGALVMLLKWLKVSRKFVAKYRA
jgi:hypothetical protein